MQHKIEFPVGEWRRGAVNREADVKEVQTLLKQAASNTNRSVYDPGKIDGLVAKPPRRSGTIKAITVLVIKVSGTQASLFSAYWRKLATSPGNFYILGDNCSTHASDSFVSSGVLPSGIPGLDTPNNLYKQLVAVRRGSINSYSGYLGFTPEHGGRYKVEILL